MHPALIILASCVGMVLLSIALLVWQARKRHLQTWLPAYVGRSVRQFKRRVRADRPVHVLLCIADHFEPRWGGVSDHVADERVRTWTREFPRLFSAFRDSSGRSPRHTFFYPIDQYRPREVDALAALCAAGHGEVEVHLHHEGDTAESLASTLRHFTGMLGERHGVLGRWPGGRPAYGFVHGNWALCNARRDGRWCGVNDELTVLRGTGCYADFTLPSAPEPTQTRMINSIYYATSSGCRPKSHDRGMRVGALPQPPGALMLIQGPLRLWRPPGTWSLRVENGCIQRGQPPTEARLEQWLRANIHVPSRPDWLFVKLHTHGAPEMNQQVLLGQPMVEFHQALARRVSGDSRFQFHYVTAREMYNLACAAEAGWMGPVRGALDYAVAPPRPDNAIRVAA